MVLHESAAGCLYLPTADDVAYLLHTCAACIADVILQPYFPAELALLYNDMHLQSRVTLSAMK